MPQFHLIAPSGYCINREAAQRAFSACWKWAIR